MSRAPRVVVGCYPCSAGGVFDAVEVVENVFGRIEMVIVVVGVVKSKEMRKQTIVCLWLMMTNQFPPANVELSIRFFFNLTNH